MIPIDKLKAINHVVVHNDADGTASAMIIKDVLPEVRISVVAYDSPEHQRMPAEPGMAFCDFSPYIDRTQDFVKVGAIVLDHHQRETVEPFEELGVFGENDKGEAGAYLAYREVWLPLMEDKQAWLPQSRVHDGDPSASKLMFDSLKARIEDFATLVSIRDTWQTQHPRWREASELSEALHFWPDEKLLGGIPSEDWHSQLFHLGPMLFERKLKAARRCIDGGHRWTSDKGTKCIAFVGVYQVSDAAEILDDTDINLVLAFTYYLQEGKPFLRVSCRSHTGWDVGAFARSFPGGGGHKAASGFQVEFGVEGNDANDGWREAAPNPYRHLKCLVDNYEARYGD